MSLEEMNAMTWATFYLICFVVGFVFTLISFLGGFTHLHLPPKWHLPHFGGAHGTGAHFQVRHVAAHDGSPVRSAVTQSQLAGRVPTVSPINFFTLMAFLTWFGGTGYLLTQYSRVWVFFGLAIAICSGLGGSTVVFLFLGRVLLRHERTLDPADYQLVGVIGKVSSSIREGGTGEIIFSQAGARCTSGARSEDRAAISKGAEVVITRYERGIAYVRRWEDLTK